MIEEKTIKQGLVQFTGSVRFNHLEVGGWIVSLAVLNNGEELWHRLHTQRGKPKVFLSVGKAIDYLDKVGFINKTTGSDCIEIGFKDEQR